jgi:alpha-galactosidase
MTVFKSTPIRQLLLAVMALIVFHTPALARHSGVSEPLITGLWKADYNAPGDVVIPLYLDLKQTSVGGEISGRVRMTWGFETIQHADVTKHGFTLRFGSDILPLKVEGRRAADKLMITVFDPRTKPVTLQAYRIAALPGKPARLPLPAIANVEPTVRLATPPLGWNSWNRFNEHIDDKAVREIADAMVSSGLRDAGYRYVVIDDSWAAKRGEDGKLRGNSKFPDMKALADYVHSKGLLFGLYSAPGPTTCGGYPGSYGYETQDAQTFADWGVDFLKYDWCSAGDIYSVDEMQAVYQKMGRALADTGRPIVYSICQYGLGDVTRWGPLVGGNLWRTVFDIQSSWASIRKNIELNMPALATVQPNAWADPDMLQVGNGSLTDAENRSHFSLWALAAAPLMLGNDIRVMPESIRAILTNKEVLAINQDIGARPGQRVGTDGPIELWRRELADGSVVIAMVNLTNAPVRYRPDFSKLQVTQTQPGTALRDIWTGQAISQTTDITLQAHDTAIARSLGLTPNP